MTTEELTLKFAKDFAELVTSKINKEPNTAYYYAFRHGAHEVVLRMLDTLSPEERKKIMFKVADFYD